MKSSEILCESIFNISLRYWCILGCCVFIAHEYIFHCNITVPQWHLGLCVKSVRSELEQSSETNSLNTAAYSSVVWLPKRVTLKIWPRIKVMTLLSYLQYEVSSKLPVKNYGPGTIFCCMWSLTLTFGIWPWVKTLWMDNHCVNCHPNPSL